MLPLTGAGAAIVETLRRICRPGNGVIITTPVSLPSAIILPRWPQVPLRYPFGTFLWVVGLLLKDSSRL